MGQLCLKKKKTSILTLKSGLRGRRKIPDGRSNKADLAMKRDYETWTECRCENT